MTVRVSNPEISKQIHTSQFRNGNFIWDELNECLLFVSRETRDARERQQSRQISVGQHASASIGTLCAAAADHRFRDNIDSLAMSQFRKFYQRKVKLTEPAVVTLQDIKDVTIFLTKPSELTPEFISYFHTKSMDRFLRSVIVYFQYYFQVWENMQERRIEASRKLYQPRVTTLENIIRDNLSDLRSMVGRNYAIIITGEDDALKFHHMNNENHVSLSDKDRRLFETLMLIAGRVVWISLYRKYLNLIEMELNRLLRTNIFNPHKHSACINTAFDTFPDEERILTGKAFRTERKLKHRSPAMQELVFDDHDFRMLAIGVLELQPFDDRQSYLEATYAAPEEDLTKLGIGLGIVGMPRKYFDPMLKPNKQGSGSDSSSRRESSTLRLFPNFQLPPKVYYSDIKVDLTQPKVPCKYSETIATKKNRIKQCKMWRKYVCNLGDGQIGFGESQSISPSFMVSARTSVLTWREV